MLKSSVDMGKKMLDLVDVLLDIKDRKVMKNFLIDITTPAELNTLQERLNVAFLLNEGGSYKDISSKTGASTTTITRVARFLKNEKFGGYRWVVKNLFKTKTTKDKTKSAKNDKSGNIKNGKKNSENKGKNARKNETKQKLRR